MRWNKRQHGSIDVAVADFLGSNSAGSYYVNSNGEVKIFMQNAELKKENES